MRHTDISRFTTIRGCWHNDDDVFFFAAMVVESDDSLGVVLGVAMGG